jgi:hypothetical protein
MGTATCQAKPFFFDQDMSTIKGINGLSVYASQKRSRALELVKGLIVPVVFASFREIVTIQPNRAAYVMRILIVEDETLVALGTPAALKRRVTSWWGSP